MEERIYRLRDERRDYRRRLAELEKLPASTPEARDARDDEVRVTRRQLEIIEQVILRAQSRWLSQFRATGSVSSERSAWLQEDGLLGRVGDCPSVHVTLAGERLLTSAASSVSGKE